MAIESGALRADNLSVSQLVDMAPRGVYGHTHMLETYMHLIAVATPIDRKGEVWQSRVERLWCKIMEQSMCGGGLPNLGLNSREVLALSLETKKGSRDHVGDWFYPVIGKLRDLLAVQIFGRERFRGSRMFDGKIESLFLSRSKGWFDAVYDGIRHGDVCEFGIIVGGLDGFRVIHVTLPFSPSSFASRMSPEMFFVGRKDALNALSGPRHAKRQVDPWWGLVKGHNEEDQFAEDAGLKLKRSFGVRAIELLQEKIENGFRIDLRRALFASGYLVRMNSLYKGFPPYLSVEIDPCNWLEPPQARETKTYNAESANRWEFSSNELRFYDRPTFDPRFGYEIIIGYSMEGDVPVIDGLKVTRRIRLGETSWMKKLTVGTGEEPGTKWYKRSPSFGGTYPDSRARPSEPVDIQRALLCLKEAEPKPKVQYHFDTPLEGEDERTAQLLIEEARRMLERLMVERV